jgi:hypothetical protein
VKLLTPPGQQNCELESRKKNPLENGTLLEGKETVQRDLFKTGEKV